MLSLPEFNKLNMFFADLTATLLRAFAPLSDSGRNGSPKIAEFILLNYRISLSADLVSSFIESAIFSTELGLIGISKVFSEVLIC